MLAFESCLFILIYHKKCKKLGSGSRYSMRGIRRTGRRFGSPVKPISGQAGALGFYGNFALTEAVREGAQTSLMD